MTEQPATVRRTLARVRRALLVPGSVTRQQDQARKQLARQAQQIEKLTASLAEVKAQLRPVTISTNHRDFEHETLTTQVGLVEERLGILEQLSRTGSFVAAVAADGSDDADGAGDADVTEARSLVDEVRREHAQVRVRMQIISQYEERLRRVEDSLAELSDGDHRRLV